jgi:hypothetical protein
MWKSGQSGNPKGRPKADFTIRDVARAHTPEAALRLLEISTNRNTSPSTQFRALKLFCNLAWGKV